MSSSSADSFCFEGPEKLLEIWFAPTEADLPTPEPVDSNDGVQRRPQRDGDEWKGLRQVPRQVWEDMLDIVQCKVLSFVEGEETDAYLLSESSLFIFSNRLILKTCGTTLNLLGLPRILSVAKTYAGLDCVYRCFYSRKSFMFPERQQGPHGSGWGGEVEFLDDIFDNGFAYTVGPTNGDHWLLYITSPRNPSSSNPASPRNLASSIATITPSSGESPSKPPPKSKTATYAASSSVLEDAIASAALHFPQQSTTSSASSSRSNSTSGADGQAMVDRRPPPHDATPSSSVERPLRLPSLGTLGLLGKAGRGGGDQTLELLMTHLSAKGRGQFYPPAPTDGSLEEIDGIEGGKVMSAACGLAGLFPASLTTLDSYAFSPCGYSANALVRTPPASAAAGGSQEGYWTVHVTPEEGYSYASFETNITFPAVSTPPAAAAVAPAGAERPFPDLRTVIREVVDIFEPGRLTVTMFVEHEPSGAGSADDEDDEEQEGTARARRVLMGKSLLEGFTRKDKILYSFEGYDLIFSCFALA